MKYLLQVKKKLSLFYSSDIMSKDDNYSPILDY